MVRIADVAPVIIRIDTSLKRRQSDNSEMRADVDYRSKDVKAQLFNPAWVTEYQSDYCEKRQLRVEHFNNDNVDG